MLEHFSKLLKDRYRLKKNRKLILAVSGGVDSVVMCDLVHRAGFEFAIAHVNFLLRGDDSNKDEDFVKDLSKRYNVPFYSIRENADFKAKDWKMSIQMAARKIRYDYFNRLLDDFGYEYLLTAHHLNDSFETAILNFIKSGSYSAISGIPSINENVLRPLISFSRSEILNYAEKNGLTWREDQSNSSLKYQRNLLRHKIIPVANEINPSFLKTFSEGSDQLHLLKFYLEKQLEKAQNDWIHKEEDIIKIEIDHLRENPNDIFIFWEFLKSMNFNFKQFQEVVGSINSESGKRFLSGKLLCVKDREHFIISANNMETEELLINDLKDPIRIGNKIITIDYLKEGIQIENNENIALVDAGMIEFPLKLRIWKEGDKFRPLGMKGEKKISDFLIDLKVPINLKRKQYVLLSGDDIMWVVGYRINNKYRITENTKQAIRFEVK